jgi:hypothetical protein
MVEWTERIGLDVRHGGTIGDRVQHSVSLQSNQITIQQIVRATTFQLLEAWTGGGLLLSF